MQELRDVKSFAQQLINGMAEYRGIRIFRTDETTDTGTAFGWESEINGTHLEDSTWVSGMPCLCAWEVLSRGAMEAVDVTLDGQDEDV